MLLNIVSAWATCCTLVSEKTFAFFTRREADFTDAMRILILTGIYFLLSGGILISGIIWLICKFCF
jgi:hypothetical protein